MELFKNTHFDFLGKKWPFIIASLILTVLGLGSLAIKGGPRYGIEFKGGMLMTVKFQGAPPLDQVRSSLTKVLANVFTAVFVSKVIFDWELSRPRQVTALSI